MSLLALTGISKDFTLRARGLGRRQVLRALDGVDLTIEKGETLALVGESGCGKSTLGWIVAGLQDATTGRLTINGLPPLSTKKRARQIQIVFQDPFGSLNPKMSVGALVAEPVVLHGLATRDTVGNRVSSLMNLVGLRPNIANRYPHELSGGQRQRVALARALAAEPELIVCDEAVSALDVSVQAQIANLLQEIQVKTGVSFLFISHGLSLVRHISHRVAVMYLGRIVELGPTDSVFDNPRHPYTRALISATLDPLPGANRNRTKLSGEIPSPLALPSGCRFRTRCPYAADRCARAEPELPPGVPAAACWFSDDLPPFNTHHHQPPPRMLAALDLYRSASARRFQTLEETPT